MAEALRASKRAVVERFGPESMAPTAAYQIVDDGAQRIGKPRVAKQTVGRFRRSGRDSRPPSDDKVMTLGASEAHTITAISFAS